ncbi:hypothetical protein RRG08_045844 [Elysia crispata]|uniref:Uncharacterized protein n=1 Tax=Elysia crispata TaxID=231223 RepID=A0AAE1E9J0_9GAST|nr:hypothetical protein RRG08_045844 [Elysia crispata]
MVRLLSYMEKAVNRQTRTLTSHTDPRRLSRKKKKMTEALLEDGAVEVSTGNTLINSVPSGPLVPMATGPVVTWTESADSQPGHGGLTSRLTRLMTVFREPARVTVPGRATEEGMSCWKTMVCGFLKHSGKYPDHFVACLHRAGVTVDSGKKIVQGVCGELCEKKRVICLLCCGLLIDRGQWEEYDSRRTLGTRIALLKRYPSQALRCPDKTRRHRSMTKRRSRDLARNTTSHGL